MVTLVSLALGLLANGGLPAPAPGASDPAQLESRVKAAFLPKLAAFVEWPASAFARPDSPIVLGILGDDPFGEEFEVALRAQKAQGRAFLLKRFREVAELTSCQMLFVSPAATARWPEIQALLKDAPTLTIGDADQFIENGGMINFVKEESKVRFQINMDASDRAGLKISVKLLQVSRVFRNGRWAK